MFAGHDTSSSAIQNTIVLLCQHPEIQEKLFKSVQNSPENLDFEQLSSHDYLDKFVREVLRFAGPVGIISRTATADFEIEDHVVPKGTEVWLNLYAINRDRKVWGEDAEDFKPERWNDPPKDAYAFVPFSAGMRNCIGKRFAIMEVKLHIYLLAKNFQFEFDNPNEKVDFYNAVIYRPYKFPKVRISKRK